MSGGSQHNPNGRQSQLGPGWSPLQLQVANFLARAPQVHMPADRGVTWHTPTPPPHLYHVPAPSPPDPLQAMKSAGSNSVYRHTGTPPELYRHTPTPPDKHLMRHTPSPGDVKAGAALPQPDMYPHLGPGREKLRPEELLAYARVGVDLSLSGARAANGSPAPHAASPALSVRDAPTINSLIARAQPRHHHARVDALLERLVPAPASPHSVIVHPRAQPTPSPPSSNEDSADSCGAPPGSKRKRKPERTIRVPTAPPPPLHPALAQPPAPDPAPASLPAPACMPAPASAALPACVPAPACLPAPAPVPAPPAPEPAQPPPETRVAPASPPKPIENGDIPHMKANGPEKPASPPPPQPPPARRKTRSGSAETIDDIAAMIASDRPAEPPPAPAGAPVSVDSLKSVLASPEPKRMEESIELPMLEERLETKPNVTEALPQPEVAAPAAIMPPTTAAVLPAPSAAPPASAAAPPAADAPRRGRARASHSESANVPVDSPEEAKPAEPETSSGAPTAEPTAASFVEVENQLEKMFAGIEEEPVSADAEPRAGEKAQTAKAKKRRKSAPTKGERKAARRQSRASTDEGGLRRKAARKKEAGKARRKEARDAYDSGSNASSGRSRGPYIQIRGPRDSPLSVSVINASTGEEDAETALTRRKGGEEFRNGLRARGLHASTLGLRYDATTPDATWLCVFCERGPHAAGLGDLFGPYTVDTDCEEYRALDEATRRRYSAAESAASPGTHEVWFHLACGVWAPGLVAVGARVWGLPAAVWAARGARCGACGRRAAALACAARACRLRAHLPCARAAGWALQDDAFRALCPAHADH